VIWKRLNEKRPAEGTPVLLYSHDFGLYDVGWVIGDLLVRNQAGAPLRAFTGWWWHELPSAPGGAVGEESP